MCTDALIRSSYVDVLMRRLCIEGRGASHGKGLYAGLATGALSRGSRRAP
jgi:hypothetical protein